MRKHVPGISVPSRSTAIRGASPAFRVLSNGEYRVLIGSAGAGWSAHRETSVNPWAGDPIEDRDGIFLYLRDLDSRRVWSAGLRPTQAEPDRYEFQSSAAGCTTRRLDLGVDLAMDVCVHPSQPLEIRRVRIADTANRPRRLEVTSYAEIALSSRESFRAHPVFSKLFLETAFDPELRAILVRRRKRGENESHPVLFHSLLEGRPVEAETDRARFLGRGRDARDPAALRGAGPLSGTSGFVLDAVTSLRCAMHLAPGASATATFVWGFVDEEEGAAGGVAWGSSRRVGAILAPLRGGDGVARAMEQTAGAEVKRRTEAGIDASTAESLQDVAGAALYGLLGIHSSEGVKAMSGEPQDGGPVRSPFLVVVRADLPGSSAWLDAAVRAHRYWRALGLPAETVVIQSGSTSPAIPGAEEGLRWIARGRSGDAEISAWIASAHVVIDRPLPEIADEARRA